MYSYHLWKLDFSNWYFFVSVTFLNELFSGFKSPVTVFLHNPESKFLRYMNTTFYMTPCISNKKKKHL